MLNKIKSSDRMKDKKNEGRNRRRSGRMGTVTDQPNIGDNKTNLITY